MSRAKNAADEWLREIQRKNDAFQRQMARERQYLVPIIENQGAVSVHNLSFNQEPKIEEIEQTTNEGEENFAEGGAEEWEATEAAVKLQETIAAEGEHVEEEEHYEADYEEEDEEGEEGGSDEGDDSEEEATEEETEEEEDEPDEEVEIDEGADIEEKQEYLDFDDFVAPQKKDSLEEMLEMEMQQLSKIAMKTTDPEEEEDKDAEGEPEPTEEDIIRDLRTELEEVAEERARIELMIDFYEHRLAHGCYLKQNATTSGPGMEGKGRKSTTLSAFLSSQGEGDESFRHRFNQLLRSLNKTKRDFAENAGKLNAEFNEEIKKNEALEKEVEEEIKAFNQYRRKIAETAIFAENNRVIDMKELERHEKAEELRRGEILKLRFRNILLRNALMEKEAEVKQGINYEEMEQMLLQNQLLTAKIEQKAINNDRVKGNLLRRVACITHVRQKTDMLSEDVSALTTECRALDLNIHKSKEQLTHLRKIKDYFRKKLEAQKRENGILGQDSLLRDMEDQFDSEARQERLLQSLADRADSFNAETARLQDMIKALEEQEIAAAMMATSKGSVIG